MRRLSLVLLPFLAAFALMFGLYYVYQAVVLIQRGQVVPAALFFVFGLMGVGLAVAIWVARKRAVRPGGVANAPTDRPSA